MKSAGKRVRFRRTTRSVELRYGSWREWIEEVLLGPARREEQADGRVRHWGYIAELGRYLRVITLSDGETVHNAFPDRGFGGPVR